MLVAAPAETRPGERRVALTPETAGKLAAAGWQVRIQAGAGRHAGFDDAAYALEGAEVVADRGAALADADVVLTVSPDDADPGGLRPGAAVIGFLDPTRRGDLLDGLARASATGFSIERLPRITRAQSMDALSSQALVSGYRSVLLAATMLPRFFPMSMTAAGTIPPAKVLVLGAGVAGLQAIATARRLGAVVSAYDVRAAAKEEVASLGGHFIELPMAALEGSGGYAREMDEDYQRQLLALLTDYVRQSDVIITTAAVPGRAAPRLVTKDMLDGCRPGCVVVDLAAETGGNVEGSVPGEEVEVHGARVLGMANAPSGMPDHASALYARNLATLLLLMTKDGEFAPDFDDEVVAGCCVVRDGEVRL